MSAIQILQNDDGLWAVTAPSLVVTGLTKETAETLASLFLKLRDGSHPSPA